MTDGRYELRRKVRHMPGGDQREVLRFQDYLRDKVRLSPQAFAEKWSAYEMGDSDVPVHFSDDQTHE